MVFSRPSRLWIRKGFENSKKIFNKFITDYFIKRKELIAAFLLIDLRHKSQTLDLEFMRWLSENYIPFQSFSQRQISLKKKKSKGIPNTSKHLKKTGKKCQNISSPLQKKVWEGMNY